MLKLFSAFLWLLICVAAFAPLSQPCAAQQRLAITADTLHLRADTSFQARTLLTIPAHKLLTVQECTTLWCLVSYDGTTGYVAVRYLNAERPRVSHQGKGYYNAYGKWVPSPTKAKGNRAPAGASAKCRDGTYSFSASRRGTCSHHGGVAQWL